MKTTSNSSTDFANIKVDEIDTKYEQSRNEFIEQEQKEDAENRSIIFDHITLFDTKYPSIYTIEFFVAGIFYRSHDAKVEAILAVAGDPVKLYHDKNNMYDNYSVKVKYNNYNIGYVPKDQSQEVLESMWKYEYKAIIIHSYETYNYFHDDHDLEVMIKVYFQGYRPTNFLMKKNVAVCGEFDRYKPSTIQRIVQDSGGNIFKVVTKNVHIVIMGKEERSDRKRRILSWIEEGIDIRIIEEEEFLRILKKN